ncbi:unnamed protein product [Ixodes hexagonus]
MEELNLSPHNADPPMSSAAGMTPQDPKRASTRQASSFYSSKTTYLTPLDRKRLRALENEPPVADQVESPVKKIKLRPRKPAAAKSKKRPPLTKINNKKQTAAPRTRTSSVIVPLSESRMNTASDAGVEAKSPSKKTRKFFSSGLRTQSATAVSWNGKFDLRFKPAVAATKSAGNLDVGGRKPIVMTVPFNSQQAQQLKTAVLAVDTKPAKPPEGMLDGVLELEPKTCDIVGVPTCFNDEPPVTTLVSPLEEPGNVDPQLEPYGKPKANNDLKVGDLGSDDVKADNDLKPQCEPGADVKAQKDDKFKEDHKDKGDCMLKRDDKLRVEPMPKDDILGEVIRFGGGESRADDKHKTDGEQKADCRGKAGGTHIKDGRGGRVTANYSQAEADDKVGCSSFKVTTVSDDKPSCSKALIFISAEKENQKSPCGADDTGKAATSRANVSGIHGDLESPKGHSFQDEPSLDDLLPLPEANLTPPKQAVGSRNPLMTVFSSGRNSGGTPLYPVFSTPVHTQTRMETRCRIKTSPIAFQKKFLCNSADPSQLIIDAGQKHFGAITCNTCGMVYSAGEMEDEKLHSRFHQAFMGVLKFPGWKKQREVGIYYDGKIIMVSFSDPKFMLKKMEEIGQMVDRQVVWNLGILETTNSTPPPRMYFVFVSNDKKVLGFLVAQQIKEAYRVIPSETREITCDSYLCESSPVPAICGVSRIWTAPFYRRKKVATRLLDRLRTNFSYGCLVELSDLAFSDPTMMGRSLAAAYTRNDRFLVFR